MNIFCLLPNENWIVDRLGFEYKQFSSLNVDTKFNKHKQYDIIWLFGSWCWKHIDYRILQSHKVVCSIHHIVPRKFNENIIKDFLIRDRFVNQYLTYNEETKNIINKFSTKNVTIIPHWINDKFWKHYDKNSVREILNIPKDKFIIGSFQRDTEGFDLKTPKLEKGPDIFVKKVIDISKTKDIHVVLGGYRRNYVIDCLKQHNISFTYFEKPHLDIINMLYSSLDLYIISSREEGGPQALFECAYLKVPFITTKTGQYKRLTLLDNVYDENDFISNDKITKVINNKDKIYEISKKYFIENIAQKYDNFFKKV